MVVTALVSLLTVGTINFFAARQLLQDGSRAQLVDVAESRVVSIERGLGRVLDRTSTTGADQGVVDALVDFSSAVDSLDDVELTDEERSAVDDFYLERAVAPLNELGGDVTLADVEPSDDVGRYLQYHYTLPAQTGEQTPGDDDSGYARALAEHDAFLTGIVDQGGVEDLLLIGLEGRVVYSAQKYIDLGTDLRNGPFNESELARAAVEDLPRVRVGDSVVADFERYLPGGGQPAMFVLVVLKDGVETVGILAMRVPIAGLNAITTSNGEWERTGLGDGETYVVSTDEVLLSESRAWIEDPEGYLDEVDDDLATLIEAFGSPVGLQTVDTAAVRAALDGETFTGTSSNYLGDSTFAYARRATIDGLDWVVVAEQPIGELRAPLWNYAGRLGLVVLILLPIAGLLGYLLADRLTRSIVPVVDMAEAVVAGERDLEVPDLGANEVGDLARQLGRMARELGVQEAALAAEFEERRRMLRSVLPARLVDDDGEIDGTGRMVDSATVIALIVDLEAADRDDEEEGELLARISEAIHEFADQYGVERVRSAADRHLLVAGLGRDDVAAESAIEFVRAVRSAATDAFDDQGETTLTVFAGLASGTVATGVLERGNLTFGVWGEPVRRALAIAALSTSAGVLVDETTVAALDGRVELSDADDVVALDGEPMTLSTLAQSNATP